MGYDKYMKTAYVIKLSTGKLLGAYTSKRLALREYKALWSARTKAYNAYYAYNEQDRCRGWDIGKEAKDAWNMRVDAAIQAALSKEELECCQGLLKDYTPRGWIWRSFVFSEIPMKTEKRAAKKGLDKLKY